MFAIEQFVIDRVSFLCRVVNRSESSIEYLIVLRQGRLVHRAQEPPPPPPQAAGDGANVAGKKRSE